MSGLTLHHRRDNTVIGGVEALWKPLKLTDTIRISNDSMFNSRERAVKLLLSLQNLRRRSRRVDAAVVEAALSFSKHLENINAGDDERTRRFAGFVEDLQAK